jgi:hypothetical protein
MLPGWMNGLLMTEQLQRIAVRLGCLLSIAILQGCAVSQNGIAPILPTMDATPDLSARARFDMNATASSGGKILSMEGGVQFQPGAALLELRSEQGMSLGRLLLQPEACRDDASAACQRRFVASGRLQAFGISVSCLVPIRNDVAIGYAGQALSGVCQDQYGRSYAIHLYGR